MKKIALFFATFALCSLTANAQLGGLVKKAANKVAEKTIDKASDKASDAINKEIDKQFDNNTSDSPENSSNIQSDENITYESLMRQLPELPTVQQFLSHKDAEQNGQGLKLLTSPITKYSTTVMSLSMQSLSLVSSNIDSTQATEMAYKFAEQTTGMSREELEKLSTMSEDEQEAYIQAHYQNGTAEAAILKDAEELAQYMEPIQPIIDKWTEIDNQIEEMYSKADDKCKSIYKKYSSQLAKANSDKERNKLLLSYYSETLPIQREAVQKAMETRLNEQLPIAEKIEKEMASIRAKHENALSVFINYPQMTASRYFMEYTRLTEITEYND